MDINVSEHHDILLKSLEKSISHQNWDDASVFLQAFVDTWPVAACMPIANQRWSNQQYDPLTLGILMRAMDIHNLCGANSKPLELPDNLPPYCEIEGHELAHRRAELCDRAARGELDAVVFLSEPPSDPDTMLALGELRMEAKAQRSVELYGLPGLMVPDAEPFHSLLGAAPKGQFGPDLRQACDVAILPGIPAQLAQGQSQPVGWLLWSGPARPLPIMPIAFEVLRRISLSAQQISEELGIDESQVEQIVREMVQIGAATMAKQER